MKVLFLLVNGIGYGHFQRSILIAEELRKLNHETFFITQAGSVRIFENHKSTVLNFPLIHKLTKNHEKQFILNIINSAIEIINPELIIEDTYPDDWLLSLPAVKKIKKILILRRIDSESLDKYRVQGNLALYDKILCLQKLKEFISDCRIPVLKTVVMHSDKFKFIGPIFRTPDKKIKKKIKSKYPKRIYPQIVVSAGAGGEHPNETYCKDLYRTVLRIAYNMKKMRINVNFIIVTGIYFKLNKQIKIPSNTRIVQFEPDLNCLLSQADICILRPGFNSTYEALSGNSQIILVPGVSYMEQQEEWVKNLKKKFSGIKICTNINSDLESLIIKNLIKKNNRVPIKSNVKIFANQINKIKFKKIRKTKKENGYLSKVTSDYLYYNKWKPKFFKFKKIIIGPAKIKPSKKFFIEKENINRIVSYMNNFISDSFQNRNNKILNMKIKNKKLFELNYYSLNKELL